MGRRRGRPGARQRAADGPGLRGSQARAATEAAQARSADARSLLAALKERLAAAEAECARLDHDASELAGRIAAALGRAVDLDRRRAELAAELEESERLIAETLGLRDRALGEVASAEDAVRDLRNELEGREQSLKERRRERETLRDALSELEVARARTESDLDHLARECHQAVGQTAAEAAAVLTDEDKAKDEQAGGAGADLRDNSSAGPGQCWPWSRRQDGEPTGSSPPRARTSWTQRGDGPGIRRSPPSQERSGGLEVINAFGEI